MNIVNYILELLDGKKTVIFSLLGLTAGYLLARNIIGEVDFYFIGGIITILGGGASAATKILIPK
jgi:hypothetical protein